MNEIHEMDKENIEIQFFTAAIIILIAPKVKKMVPILLVRRLLTQRHFINRQLTNNSSYDK